MRAVQVQRFGGPEVFTVVTVDRLRPGPGEAGVDVAASGVNFIDVYHRTGHYPNPLPFTPGSEGAGTVSAVGPGVTGVRVGDRSAGAEVVVGYDDVPAAAREFTGGEGV